MVNILVQVEALGEFIGGPLLSDKSMSGNWTTWCTGVLLKLRPSKILFECSSSAVSDTFFSYITIFLLKFFPTFSRN